MRYIDNLRDLDEELRQVDRRFQVSDDEGRKALDGFCYSIGRMRPPADPFSKEYHDFQMGLYRTISGRGSYGIENEASQFNFDDAWAAPFPFSTHSAVTVGDHLLAIGYIIKKSRLPPASQVVEFGLGWGNTTLALCQMGHKVTCVEAEKGLVDLIKYRTRDLPAQPEFFYGDMLDYVTNTDKTYDAAIFFESFHHCSRPFEMLERLPDILNDQGIACFAAEPLVSRPSRILPYPWGIRLDGMSVWSIRHFGWMELGFDISFFIKALNKYGLDAEVHSSRVSPLASMIIARKTKNPGGKGSLVNPREYGTILCKMTLNKALSLRPR